MKLWIFGDSFAELKNNLNIWEWQIQVSNHLKCDLFNVAHNGASSEWIILQLSEYQKKISKEDIVIVLVPYWDRQCIFPEDPDFTHLVTIDQYKKDKEITKRWNKYTSEQRDAFRKYFLYLHNDKLTKLKTLSLYKWINSLNLNTVPIVLNTRDQDCVLDGNYTQAKGCLMDVSMSEWIDTETWYTLSKHSLFDDPRISHLSKKNHDVLAKKIINWIDRNEDIVLTNGFHSNFLNENLIDID
jgi:hypothetical protein